MTAQAVSIIVWGLATLGMKVGEGPMRGALEGAAVRVALRMTAQNVANIIWGLATLGWQPTERAMRGALQEAAARVAPRMKPQEVGNTIWGLVTLGWQASSEMAAVFQQLVEAFVEGGVSGPVQLASSTLSQLLQAHLASQYLGLGWITLPPSMLQAAVQAHTEASRTVIVSNGQREVGESLRRLGISHELEYTTADGLFSIDLAISDRRIALEFDGPSHFTTNTLEPLGHTRLRDQLLSAMGWHVVSIPFFDWNRLRNRPEQIDAYVKQRLVQKPSKP
jgi:hypothetical protein